MANSSECRDCSRIYCTDKGDNCRQVNRTRTDGPLFSIAVPISDCGIHNGELTEERFLEASGNAFVAAVDSIR